MNVKIFSLSVIAQATGDLSYSPGALQGATVKKGNHLIAVSKEKMEAAEIKCFKMWIRSILDLTGEPFIFPFHRQS